MLSAFQQFFLRLDVSVQYPGYCFGVSTSTASRVFLNTISVMHARLVHFLSFGPTEKCYALQCHFPFAPNLENVHV